MTTVYYVRHAEPNYDNHDDAARELTDKGLRDRSLVTRYLRDKGIHCVFSSPFRRAVDTVAEFANQSSLPVVIKDGFRERRIDSVWIEDYAAFSRKQWSDFTYRTSGGESLGEVQARNIAALRDVLAERAGSNIVIGSHGTALGTVMNYYDKSFGYEEFERIRTLMPWIVRFQFDGMDFISLEPVDVFAATGC